MFVILLKFARNKDQASAHMEAHKQWLKRGFDDGIFLLAGSIKPGQGGAVLAHGITMEELEMRVKEDPFIEHQIVTSEITEIAPSRADERLSFLLSTT